MTRERTYQGGTEFSLWIRQQKELDSHLGYKATDVDYVWLNSNSGLWMLIEEKRYGWYPKDSQHHIFSILNKACCNDKNYRGYHLITFENTNPEDGLIHLNDKDITKEDLIKFFQFDKDILSKYIKDQDIITQKFTPKFVDNIPKIK